MKKFTIDDVLLLNKTLIENSQIDICFSNGMAGFNLDLETAKHLRDALNEVLLIKKEEQDG